MTHDQCVSVYNAVSSTLEFTKEVKEHAERLKEFAELALHEGREPGTEGVIPNYELNSLFCMSAEINRRCMLIPDVVRTDAKGNKMEDQAVPRPIAGQGVYVTALDYHLVYPALQATSIALRMQCTNNPTEEPESMWAALETACAYILVTIDQYERSAKGVLDVVTRGMDQNKFN